MNLGETAAFLQTGCLYIVLYRVSRDEQNTSNYRQLKVSFNSLISPVWNLAHNFQMQLKSAERLHASGLLALLKVKKKGVRNANSGQQKRFVSTHSSYRNFRTKVYKYDSSPFSPSKTILQQYSYITSKSSVVQHHHSPTPSSSSQPGSHTIKGRPQKHPHPVLMNSLGRTTLKTGHRHLDTKRGRCCAYLLHQHATLWQGLSVHSLEL